MPSEPQRESLPFEPKSKKQSSDKAPSSPPQRKPANRAVEKASKQSTRMTAENDTGIPEVVSRRMIRRMGFFAGVPTALGMSSFIVAYFLLTQQIVEFPNVVVLLVSLGFFGLGTLGLSYGVLSASWQEDVEGSLLGVEEFSVNFRRLIQGLRTRKPSAPDNQ